MTVRPVQFNIQQSVSFKKKEAYKSYLEAEGAVHTDNNVKPLPPKGHLVHDKFGNGVKYFFKDIAYDMKAVKDGFKGTANDHQLGRLNDVGLKLGGIGIATYLASKTNDPKVRLMEYVGLGTFLTVMSIYPKLFINAPAKLKHGFDIDKQYIDDQGRKKSVMQDANYIPYDMYRAEYSDEDLQKIGDKLGIPKDIKNRNEVTKEQMRKISTQNNTLWMLTAGLATPALTALGCNLIENHVVIPALAKANEKKVANEIAKILAKTQNMQIPLNTIQASKLSIDIEKILKSYSGQELPTDELQHVIKTITKNLDKEAASGIKEDIINIIKTGGKGQKSFFFNSEAIDNMISQAQKAVKGSENFQKTVVPTKAEIEAIIKDLVPKGEISKGVTLPVDKITEFRAALSKLIDAKIDALKDVPEIAKKGFRTQKQISIEAISKNIKMRESTLLTDDVIKKLVNFSKIIGEFKENLVSLDKCKSMKFEFNPNSALAQVSAKFEKMVLKELGISFKEMKMMRESSEITRRILDEKFAEICKDETRYKSFVEKIGKHLSQLEKSLNGSDAERMQIKDLINAIEYNYNNTAKRLESLDPKAFRTTIKKLINDDASSVEIQIRSRAHLNDFLDGLMSFANSSGKEFAKGKGSSKNLMIDRLFSRYQGSKNIYHRFLHALEIHKRAMNSKEFGSGMTSTSNEYVNEVIKRVKDTVMEASSKKHTLKLDIVTDENLYRDIMDALFKDVKGWKAKEKGFVTRIAREALNPFNGELEGKVLDRYQYYLGRFKNLISNNTTDFTKPNHIFEEGRVNMYTKNSRTPNALYDLISQSPVDFVKNASKNQYGTQKWLRIVGAIAGSVVGITLLAQFGFGKLNNPQNLKRQVSEDETK